MEDAVTTTSTEEIDHSSFHISEEEMLRQVAEQFSISLQNEGWRAMVLHELTVWFHVPVTKVREQEEISRMQKAVAQYDKNGTLPKWVHRAYQHLLQTS